jgi:outer membrane protein OmpA-like peptidoglycan-associated protein
LFATNPAIRPSMQDVSTTSDPRFNDDGSDRQNTGGTNGDKLIPEWRVDADDQVVLAGLAVFAAILLALGWNAWQGTEGRGLAAAASTAVEAFNSDDDDAAGILPAPDEEVAAPVTTAVSTTSTTEQVTTVSTTSTTEAEAVIGDVQGAVDLLPGSITGVNDGTTAVLTGFVANQTESDAAEAAAAAVDGIEAVDNRLQLLEPAALAAMEAAGVTRPSATGSGTDISVSGTIAAEEERQPTLDAVAAVEGVTSVIDNRLEVSVTADLNLLPQVQFATASAEILPVSFSDLDAGAELLLSADPSIRIEVQGFTDVRGDEQANLDLSQARAEAVRSYLLEAGVNAAMLTAAGYGETTQFAEGDSAEAYRANRVVRFVQVG